MALKPPPGYKPVSPGVWVNPMTSQVWKSPVPTGRNSPTPGLNKTVPVANVRGTVKPRTGGSYPATVGTSRALPATQGLPPVVKRRSQPKPVVKPRVQPKPPAEPPVQRSVPVRSRPVRVAPAVAAKTPKPVSSRPATTPKPARQPAQAPAGNGMAGLYGGVGPDAYVNNIYAPLEQGLKDQQAARLAGYQQLVKEFAASMQGLGSQLAPYEQAAQQTGGLAQIAADRLAAANPNAQTQADLAAIGAPQAQRDAVTGQNQTAFGGNAALLQYTGGAIPADVFRQDAAGRAAYLRMLPVMGQKVSEQGLNQLGFKAGQETLDIGSKKAAALQQARTDLANYVQKNQALRTNQSIADAELGLKSRSTVAGITGIDPATGLPTLSTRKAVASNAIRQKQLATSNAIRLKQLGISEAGLRLRAAALDQKLKKGKYTPAMVVRLKSTAADTAHDGFNGITDKKGNVIQPPQSYQQVFSDLTHHGIPPSIAEYALNQYWLPDAPGSRITAAGGQKFVTFPWEQPGQGRPLGAPTKAKKKRR
jgi:hypothetical protein